MASLKEVLRQFEVQLKLPVKVADLLPDVSPKDLKFPESIFAIIARRRSRR